MEKESARQKKRDSALKTSGHAVYTKKAVRIKEALLEKTCKNSSGPQLTSH
jgi:hypothetical protein